MRLLKVYITLAFVGWILSSCQRELSCYDCPPPGTDTTGAGQPVKNEWQFDEIANRYSGPVDTAYITQYDTGELLTITGTSAAGNENFFISIKSFNGEIKPGEKYSVSNQQVKFYYYNDGDTIYFAVPYLGGDISVTITAIDSNKVQGVFSGIAIDKDNKSRNISNGQFSSSLKTTAANTDKGSVIMWAKQLCSADPIKVKLNNVYGEINIFSYSPPDCGDQRWPNFTVDTGTYKWVAYCGKDSISGDVTVKANSCVKVLVEFIFTPADTTITTEAVCKLNTVSYSGCLLLQCDALETYLPFPNTVSASFSSQTVTQLQYFSYAAGFQFNSQNIITNSDNRIYINESTPQQCYFTKDASGKIIEYRGMKHPEVIYPLDSIVVKYKYDNGGNLITRTVYDAHYLKPLKETGFTWQDGNVVQTIEKNLAAGGKTITDFTYYTDRIIKQQPFIFTQAFELLLFQPLVDFGNRMKNPVKSQVVHATDNNGNPIDLSYNYNKYVVDDNDYLMGFNISRGSATTTFSFGYVCF
ncbi:MAG TPA: hypothetical protein VFW07_03010 [Parafilimonas sp.]|nr:hypothetical protein [Parafilimonas sp.]